MRFQVSKFARSAATTFAPRPSGATKNPAYKGSLLYTVFEVQAYVCLVVGIFALQWCRWCMQDLSFRSSMWKSMDEMASSAKLLLKAAVLGRSLLHSASCIIPCQG